MPEPDFDIPEFSYRRRRKEAAIDPLMRRIALGAGGVATLVIVIALVWGGVKPGLHFGPPPEIAAPPGPLRVPPANPGGLTVPGADQQIMSGQTGVKPDQLAPATPAPDISAFNTPAPAPAKPAAPAPAALAAPPPAKAEAAPPPVAAVPAAPATTNANIQVQLAAAVDPAGAHAAWAKLSGKLPGLLSGRTPLYTHAKVAGVNFYRLRVGGFTDIAAAKQFCAQIRAQGEACTVAAF